MNEDVIKCINIYMQELKLKINVNDFEISDYEKECANTFEFEEEVAMQYSSLSRIYILSKLKFFLFTLLTIGINYKDRRFYYLLDKEVLENEIEYLEDKDELLLKNIAMFEKKINKLKRSQEESIKYFNQIYSFMEYVNKDEKILSHKME